MFRFGKIIDACSRVFGFVAGALVLAIALITTYEVFMRFVLGSPTLWTQDYSIYCLVGLAFLASAYTLWKGQHIRVDFFLERLSLENKSLMIITADLLSLVYIGLLARYSLDMFAESFATMATFPTPIRPLRWPVYGLLFFGIAMLLIQQIKEIICQIGSLVRKNQAKEISIKGKSFLFVFLWLAIVGAGVWITLQINTVAGLIFLLFALMFGGIPVAFSLGSLGLIGFFYFGGMRLISAASPQVAFQAMDSYILLAIPLFVLCGQIFSSGKIGKLLLDLMSKLLSGVPAGLIGASIFSCAVFAAITGSSVACAATIGLFALPVLKEKGYNRNLSYGTLAAGGTLGILIPPSASAIIYCSVTRESLGALFMAGFVPGVILALIFAAYAMIVSVRKGEYERPERTSFKEKLVAIKESIWALGAPILILGGIYAGIFTPTEAGAVAVIYSLIVAMATKEIRLKDIPAVLMDSITTSGFILLIVVGAILFGDILTRLQVPQEASRIISEIGLSRWVVLIGVMVLWLIMGMFLEVVSILLITIPIVYPVILSLGFDGVWFGVIATLNMELALLTPPVGLNLYVIKGISGDSLENIVKGTWPFFSLLVIGIILLCFFPEIALWLPSSMKIIR